MDSYQKAKEILKEYKQEQLLAFYDELSKAQQEALIKQINSINFKQIFDLYEASKTDEEIPHNSIQPLDYIDKSSLDKVSYINFLDIGETYIRNGEYAVVTLAGGQGTRLGFKGPKGCFELDIYPKKSLFEILCDRLKEANQNYGTTIPWDIMTSIYNDKETKDFFEQKNYFGYPKNSIKFFMQSELPLIDTDENLMLEEIYRIKEASNGNGDVFEALNKSYLIKDMKNRKNLPVT